jgi:hypothetical protein
MIGSMRGVGPRLPGLPLDFDRLFDLNYPRAKVVHPTRENVDRQRFQGLFFYWVPGHPAWRPFHLANDPLTPDDEASPPEGGRKKSPPAMTMTGLTSY